MNETGFKAIQSSIIRAATSDQEGHKTTHNNLIDQKDLLQQIIRNQIVFGPTRLEARPSRGRSSSRRKSKIGTTVLWNYYSYMMPIGNMKIRLRHTLQDEDSRSMAFTEATEATIAVEFVPPRWFSQTVIQYSIKLGQTLNKLGGFRWHSDVSLNCMIINHDPSFVRAVRDGNIKQIRKAFDQGLARPTDYVIKPNLDTGPWYDVCDRYAYQIEAFD